MSTGSPTSAPSLAEASPNTGTDILSSVSQDLDLARNQFRARQITDASGSAAVLISKLHGFQNDSVHLSEQERARALCIEACALTLKGRCAEEQQRMDEAQALWQQAVRLFNENLPHANPSLDTLGYYGAALRLTGHRTQAIDIFARVIADGGAVPETYRHYGFALKDENRFAEAVDQFTKAVRLASSDLRSWQGLAESLEALGGEDHKKAAAEAFLSLARALRDSGDYAAAFKAAENSGRLDPSVPAFYLIGGDLLRLQGDYHSSLAVLDRYLRLVPDDPVGLATRGAVLHALLQEQDALLALDRALELSPRYAWAAAMKGTVLCALGQNEQAVAPFELALEIDPQLWQAASEFSRLLVALSRLPEAIQAADRALAVKPDNPLALSMRALALFLLGRSEESLLSFDQAIAANPQYDFAWSRKLLPLDQLRRQDEAIATVRHAFELNPKDVWSVSRLGILLARSADPAICQEALTLLKTSLALGPDFDTAELVASSLGALGALDEALGAAETAIQLNPRSVRAFEIKAEALRGLGKPEEALAAIESALAFGSPSANALGKKAQLLRSLKRTDDAEVALQEAIAVGIAAGDDLPWLWQELADIFYKTNRLPQAMPALDHLLRLLPGDSPQIARTLDLKSKVLVELADALQIKGENAEALVYLDEAVSISPQHALAHALRGYVLHSIAKNEEAAAALRRAAEIDPTLAWVHAELASTCLDLALPQEALRAIDQALEQNSLFPSALEIKARILIEIGENQLAIPLCESAAALDPKLWTTHYWHGMALDNLNRLEEAHLSYQQAHGMSPSDVWTRRALADILLLLQSRDAALAHFEWILKNMSSQTHTVTDLSMCGWCHYGCDRLDPAIRLYSEAVSLDLHGAVKSTAFDLALIIGCSKRYSRAKREYLRAIDLALTAHPWQQKAIFALALNDLNRAMTFRHPHLAQSPEIRESHQQLQAACQAASDDPSRPFRPAPAAASS